MSSKKLSHISIIMDGNGRWANSKGMPRAYGHRAGIKSINKIVSACSVRQIQELTLFAFSSENWKRPNYEVKFLLSLFEESINFYIDDLLKNNVQINFIGELSQFSPKLLKNIKKAEALTKNNSSLNMDNRLDDLLQSIQKLTGIGNNSSKKGEVGENMLEEIIKQRYGDIKYENKAKTPHSGDAWLHLPDKKIIMFRYY